MQHQSIPQAQARVELSNNAGALADVRSFLEFEPKNPEGQALGLELGTCDKDESVIMMSHRNVRTSA